MIPAIGVFRAPQYKSDLERDYATLLEAERRAGKTTWWAYEPWKFSIGHGRNSWYTPDFAVLTASGRLELHETKGFMREAARVRMRAAVKTYGMFTWWLVTRDRAGFHRADMWETQ